MKTKALLTALFLSAGILTCQAVVSTNPIIERLYDLTNRLEAENAQVLFTQIDHIGHDQLKSQTYTLEEGSTYSIIVFGDNGRVADIDCQVRDENDNVIGEDTDNTNTAVVTVTPRWTGEFTIIADAYEMVGSAVDAFYGIIIVREG